MFLVRAKRAEQARTQQRSKLETIISDLPHFGPQREKGVESTGEILPMKKRSKPAVYRSNHSLQNDRGATSTLHRTFQGPSKMTISGALDNRASRLVSKMSATKAEKMTAGRKGSDLGARPSLGQTNQRKSANSSLGEQATEDALQPKINMRQLIFNTSNFNLRVIKDQDYMRERFENEMKKRKGSHQEAHQYSHP
jgi:hypothetical protein